MNAKPKPDLYISVDVETTGDTPPFNSMISLGAVPFYRDGRVLDGGGIPNTDDTFNVNIYPLLGSTMDIKAQEFWDKNSEAYHETFNEQYSPTAAVRAFDAWLRRLAIREDNKHLVFVGYPAVFDFDFVKYYFRLANESNPFGFVALDLKTLAMAVLNLPRFDLAKRANFPAEWSAHGYQHTHKALDDARQQAYMAVAMFKALDQLHAEARVTRNFAKLTELVVDTVSDGKGNNKFFVRAEE